MWMYIQYTCACISDTCISGVCTYVCICTTHKYIHIATAYMYIRRTSKLLYLRYTFECIANIHVQVYQIHVYQVSIHVNSHMCIDYKHISFECCSCELYMHTRYTCVLGIPHISGNKYEPYMLMCIAIWVIHAHVYCHMSYTCSYVLPYSSYVLPDMRAVPHTSGNICELYMHMRYTCMLAIPYISGTAVIGNYQYDL